MIYYRCDSQDFTRGIVTRVDTTLPKVRGVELPTINKDELYQIMNKDGMLPFDGHLKTTTTFDVDGWVSFELRLCIDTESICIDTKVYYFVYSTDYQNLIQYLQKNTTINVLVDG